MLTPFTQTKLKPLPEKILINLDFFAVTKENYLPKEEKHRRLEAMNRVVLYSFINNELPVYLKKTDIEDLEKMTNDIDKIDLNEIVKFLNQKVKNFMQIMESKLLQLKKNLIISHYQKIVERLEKQQMAGSPQNFELVLTINRILQAAEIDDWNLVIALSQKLPPNIPYTLH